MLTLGLRSAAHRPIGRTAWMHAADVCNVGCIANVVDDIEASSGDSAYAVGR